MRGLKDAAVIPASRFVISQKLRQTREARPNITRRTILRQLPGR